MVSKKPRISASATAVYPWMNETRTRSMACVADRLGRNPYEHDKKSASKMGSMHDLRRRLSDPVPHRGDPQRPVPACWFRDVHTPGWRGTIRPGTQIGLEFGQHPLAPRTPRPSPESLDRPRQRPGCHGPASTPPTRRHPCGHGHTGRGNGDPPTAWPQPIADVAVVALSPATVPRRGLPTRPDGACRGSWTGPTRPCPHAYPLRSASPKQGPFPPDALCCTPLSAPARADTIGTTTPSDSRCTPFGFTIGLSDRSLARRQACADGSLLFRARPSARAAARTPGRPHGLTPEQGPQGHGLRRDMSGSALPLYI